MKLMIVDDDALIRKSLKISLNREADIEVVGEAANGEEAIKICEEVMPDVVLMDIRMPGIDGISATRIIKDRYPKIKVMILTTFANKMNIQQALSVGTDGYLVKTDQVADIASKLRVLINGTSVLDTSVLQSLTKKENAIMETLTPREKDLFRLVAQGLTNNEIADQLFLSPGSIRNKLIILMKKLNVENRTQLCILYYQNQ